MKRPSIFYSALASLLFHTNFAVFTSEDIICGEHVIFRDIIQKSLIDACNGLLKPVKGKKFPAVYEKSTTFLVTDAVLFAWPMLYTNRVYVRGPASDLRLIIDSSCNFFGIIIKSTSKTSPDRRCYRPAETPSNLDISDSRAVRRLPGFRGYKCHNEIFDNVQLENTLKETLTNYELWRLEGRVKILNGLKAINDLFGENILLLPSDTVNIPEQINYVPLYSNLMVLDSEKKLLGMVYKVSMQWEKCVVLWEKVPERPQSMDNTKNSIGERLFMGVKNYKCGSLFFPRESVNSHMQLACTLMMPPESISANVRNTYLTPLGIIPAIGQNQFWKLPLRLPETNEPTPDLRMLNKAVIVLDEQCNFYGVYWHIAKAITPCLESSPLSL